MMKYALMLAVATATVGTPQLAWADDAAPMATSRDSTVPVITDDMALFESFGGRAGLVKIMDDVMPRWLANAKTRPFFENADQTRIKAQLVEQFCVIMKGPCEYSGRSMADAHRGMNVSEASFYALVEELQRTLNAMDVQFRAQNRLIAALAPMHRDIIDK